MTAIGNISYSLSKMVASSEIEKQPEKVFLQNQNLYRSIYIKKSPTYLDEDELIKFGDYNEAEKIRKDPAVKSVLDTGILNVLKKDFVVIPRVEKNRKSALLAEFIDYNHSKMEGDIKEYFYELSNPGIFYGNSILEKIFYDESEGKWQGRRIYKKLSGCFNGLWHFKESLELGLYGIESLITREVIPIEKFITFHWLKVFGRNKGSGLYPSIYKYAKAIEIIYKNLIQFINKYSGRLPILSYDDPQYKSIAENLIEELYNGAEVAIPSSMKIEFVDMLGSGNTTDAYLLILNWCNSQINLAGKGTTGFSVNNGTGGSAGSRASDEVKKDTEDIYDWYLQTYLEKVWLESYVKPIILHNFPLDKYPEDLYPIGAFVDNKNIPINEIRENYKLAHDTKVTDLENSLEDQMNFRKDLGLKELSSERIAEKQKSIQDKKGTNK